MINPIERSRFMRLGHELPKEDYPGQYKKLISKNAISNMFLIEESKGGDCWGGKAKIYYNSLPINPTIPELDYILEIYWPNITYIKYKELVNTLMKETEFFDGEYYGNYKIYIVYYIEIPELYKFIIDNK